MQTLIVGQRHLARINSRDRRLGRTVRRRIARQAFNDAVTSYNSYKQSFPPVAVANFFGHGKDASLLEFEDSQAIQAAPKVSF